MITGILIAAALVGGTGLVIGLLLGVAGKKFAVEVNEKEIAVREQRKRSAYSSVFPVR